MTKFLPLEYEQNMWVGFNDLDPYGHLPTHNYLKFLISSRWIFAKRIFGMDPNDFTEKNIGFYITNTRCFYLAPITGQQEIQCCSRVVESMDSILKLSFEIFSTTTEKLLFSGTADCFCINIGTGKPCTLPTWVEPYFFDVTGELPSRSQKHYDSTEKIYPLLGQLPSDLMNFGLWPAAELKAAQCQLVEKTLEPFHEEKQIQTVLELGCGYGGALPLVKKFYPKATYTGVNPSTYQCQIARDQHSLQPQDRILEVTAEDFFQDHHETFDLCFAVEAFHHFSKKQQILTTIAKRSERLCLAKICVGKPSQFRGHPTLDEPLGECWTAEMYFRTLREVGYETVTMTDISSAVIPPMAEYVTNLPDNHFATQQSAISNQQSAISNQQSAIEIMGRMKSSFKTIMQAAKKQQLTYNLIVAHRRPS